VNDGPHLAEFGAEFGGTIGRTVAESEPWGGVLYALGNGNAGLSIFVQDDHLVFDDNAFGDHTVIESESPVPAGACVLGVRFRRSGRGATATIVVDERPVGSAEIPFAMRVISSVGSSVGFDHGMPVSER
jgi:hypothetical protein